MFLGTACTSAQPDARTTVDATQRWLNAKCPPQEACPTQDHEDETGRAFLNAVIAGDCDRAADYWVNDSKPQGLEACTNGFVLPGEQDLRCHLIEFRIDEFTIEQSRSILFSGRFLYDCDGDQGSIEKNTLKLSGKDRDGEWLIFEIDG